MTPGTLKDGEPHPSADFALQWIQSLSITDLAIWQESFSSCSIEGNRLGEICSETLRRIMVGEPVSDRYVLGLHWFMRHEMDFYGKLVEVVDMLVGLDPEADSLEGVLLDEIATAMEKYEKVKYPFPEPSAEELEKFRKEQAGG